MTRDSPGDGPRHSGPDGSGHEPIEDEDQSTHSHARSHSESKDTDAPEVSADSKTDQTNPSKPPSRHDRLESVQTPGVHNSLWSWPDAKAAHLVVRNYLLIVLARISPSLTLKNRLLAAVGIDIGEGVSWGLESTPDVFWPERITVGDHAIIGYDATILCHEFLQSEYRIGNVEIGARAMIGASATILPGVTIGDGARVAANSLVTDDVPPGTTVAGVPAAVVSSAEESSDADIDAGAQVRE
ncbi:MAG: bacterial transferase hexapeptide (three repeats) [Halorubrum sp. J07HR59]|nr:MAG: bacterial transferase hexapeptide (three repeats) [Halorubrum sp. J07HR59]